LLLADLAWTRLTLAQLIAQIFENQYTPICRLSAQ
jgi:hypothetical protein